MVATTIKSIDGEQKRIRAVSHSAVRTDSKSNRTLIKYVYALIKGLEFGAFSRNLLDCTLQSLSHTCVYIYDCVACFALALPVLLLLGEWIKVGDRRKTMSKSTTTHLFQPIDLISRIFLWWCCCCCCYYSHTHIPWFSAFEVFATSERQRATEKINNNKQQKKTEPTNLQDSPPFERLP